MVVIKKLNNKGFSLLEVVAATVIIGGSVLLASYFSVQQSKMISKSEEKVEALGAEMELLSRSVRILTDVKEAASELRTQGMCQFVDTDIKNYGIGNVFLDFSKKNVNSVFSQNNWKKVIGNDWGIVSSHENGCVTSEGTLCLRLSQNSPMLQKLIGAGAGQADAFATIKVLPTVVFKEFARGGDIFPTVPYEGRLDAKTVGFTIDAEVFISRDGTKANRSSKSSEFLWAADVEYCHIQKGKDVLRNPKTREPIRVLASATGPGDPLGKKVYNATQYKNLTDNPIQIQVPRVVPTQGKHKGGRSQVDAAFNIEVACVEKTYRCRQDNKSRDFNDNTHFNFIANYTAANTVTSNSFVKFAPELKFISGKTNKDVIEKHKKEYFENQTKPYSYYKENGVSRFYQDIGKSSLDQLSFSNRQKIAFSLNQTSSWMIKVNSTKKLCERVCEGRQDGSEFFYPQVGYRLLDIPHEGKLHYEGFHRSKMPMGCNVCYSKMCQGRTYKNFGAIQATDDPKHGPQPYEPVDGVIPECALRDTASVNSLQPYEKKEADVGRCVAAKITKSGVSYSAENCSSKLPVLCFGFGNFIVARNHFGSGSVTSHDFGSAGRRCYEIGKERLDRESMKKRFTTFGSPFNDSFPRGLASGSSSQSEYINNAKAGMFLAPQSAEQVQEAYKFLNIYQKEMLGRKVWVGLKVDQGGDIVSTPPEIHTADTNREQYSVYYNTASKILMVQQPYHIRDIASVGSSAGILTHNVRFRGVIPASANQPKNFPFLCRKRKTPFSFFLSSSQSTKFADGEMICKAQDGHFIPPTTPMGWAQAFQKVWPIDTSLAYPDPSVAANDPAKVAGAWVSYRKDGSQWSLAQTQRVSKILSGKPSSIVDKFGVYLTDEIPDPAEVESKAREISQLETEISSLTKETNTIEIQISELDPKDKDFEEDKGELESKKSGKESTLSSKKSDLSIAKNRSVPLIPRPFKYVMCEGEKAFRLEKSQRCTSGRQVSKNDLKGTLDKIKWILASENMPSGEALQLRR